MVYSQLATRRLPAANNIHRAYTSFCGAALKLCAVVPQ